MSTGCWLIGIRYGAKWYFRTPMGELAYGEGQGLYEWRDGQRIDHTGGDQQAASGGRRHTMHSSSSAKLRGLYEAHPSRRLN